MTQRWPAPIPSPLIGLLGCVKTKLPHAAAARDLYVSPLFIGRRVAIDTRTVRWFVLSAKYGLVKPEALIEPYDLALADMQVAVQREWSRNVVAELHRELGELGDFRFEIHAGRAYLRIWIGGGTESGSRRGDGPHQRLGPRPATSLLCATIGERCLRAVAKPSIARAIRR
jgi:hypothetical protein